MNSFEEIITLEKTVLYAQRDKELFSFYTLTLITQEQASKKLQKKLWASLVLFITCLALLFSPISQFTGSLINQLSAIDMIGLFYMALASYGVSGLCIVLIKKGAIGFR
jgi:hypothetical protein